MAVEDLGRYLREHPFLQGMEDRHIETIVGCASNVVFNPGDYVYREGQDASTFYFIRHGRVSVEIHAHNRGPIAIETMTEGEVLGWSWLFPPYKWHFDAKATELVRATALDGKCLRGKCDTDHELGYELLKRFAHVVVNRMQATRLQLLDIYGTHD